MKKKLATTLLAGALSASMVIPAFASSTTSDPSSDGSVQTHDSGTDVMAGVVIQDKNPIVKVEVPTLFAFVVNGSTSSETAAVTSGNGFIYLPNVQVNVDKPNQTTNTQGYDYSLTYTGDGNMKMNNYSTYETETAPSSGKFIREGLELTINGEIRESSTVAAEKNYWQYSNAVVGDIGTGDGDTAEFKKYMISIDGIGLTEMTASGSGYKMTSDITLAAPNTQYDSTLDNYGNLDTTTNLAKNPTTHLANFDVIVGGQRGQYSQVEQSAKIGTIVWTVSVDVSQDGVDTAPDSAYLQ